MILRPPLYQPVFVQPDSMTPEQIRARLAEIERQDDSAPMDADMVWWLVLEQLELEEELNRLTDTDAIRH